MNHFLRTAMIVLISLLPTVLVAQTLRTISVDPIGDDTPDLGCSLREAIDLANAGLAAAAGCSSQQTGMGFPLRYRLDLPAYRYVLTGPTDDSNIGGDLDIQGDVQLVGLGPEQTIIDGDQLGRVLQSANGHLELEDLQITGGSVNDCGGGISSADLTLRNVWVRGNQATFFLGGGGICSVDGTVRILGNSRIFDNITNDRGGGIYSTGVLELTDSTIHGNSAGLGGGVSTLGGTLTVRNSTISNNVASFGGGLFLNAATQVAMVSSAVTGNSARFGAGIYRPFSTVEMVNIANTVVANNFAARPTGNTRGGGIHGTGMLLTHVTIFGNSAETGAGIYAPFQFPGDRAFRIANTLVAGNVTLLGVFSDCDGIVSSEANNLIGVNKGCEFGLPAGDLNPNNDQVGTLTFPIVPKFISSAAGSLNFEPTADSLATDAIPAQNCVFISTPANPLYAEGSPVLLDQRGIARTALCDIGAVESTQVFVGGFESELREAPQ